MGCPEPQIRPGEPQMGCPEPQMGHGEPQVGCVEPQMGCAEPRWDVQNLRWAVQNSLVMSHGTKEAKSGPKKREQEPDSSLTAPRDQHRARPAGLSLPQHQELEDLWLLQVVSDQGRFIRVNINMNTL